MKYIFNGLRLVMVLIVAVVFIAALVITALGIADVWHGISLLGELQNMHELTTRTAIGIMEGVDTLLVAIVLLVFSYGLLVIFFSSKDELLDRLNIPKWLRMKTFLDLKIILWEAVLTTLVIGFLVTVAEDEMENREAGIHLLYIPGAITLITLSLFLLRKEIHK